MADKPEGSSRRSSRVPAEDHQHLIEDDDTASASSGIGTQPSSTSASSQRLGEVDAMGKEENEFKKVAASENEEQDKVRVDFSPPDGGFWAWLVVVMAAICNGIIFGTINSFGVIYVEMHKLYKDDGDASSKASLIGSMAIGFTFLLSSVSGVLADKYGIRLVAFTGGFFATIGMLVSSFFLHRIEILFFTYGVLFGGGSSLVYTPSLAILGHYFKKKIGLANGCVAAGSSMVTIIMPILLKALLAEVDLPTVFRILAAFMSLLMVCALTFKDLIPPSVGEDNSGCMAKLVNVDNWKNKKYVIWCLGVPFGLFGYFVPFNHIVKYVSDILPASDGSFLVSCIGITSLVGRFLFGYIADNPRVNCIVLQQIAFVAIGGCTMLLTTAPLFPESVSYPMLVIFALMFGLFDGCFISVIGPIAIELCGAKGASQAIGFVLAMCAIPLTTGSPVAGYLYDTFGNYNVAFLVAGFPPMIAAGMLSFVHCIGDKEVSTEAEMEAAAAGSSEAGALLQENNGEPNMPNVTTCTTLVADA